MTPETYRLSRLPFRDVAARLLLLFAAAYGLLYFSYKYLNPALFIGDSEYYKPLYQAPLDFHAGLSPFVLRQVSIVLTWVLLKAHIFYPAVIAYVDPGYDQHVFFAALLANWLCLVFTAMVSGLIAEELLGERNGLVAMLAAFLCLLSFHSQSAVITNIAEGPAWLLLALAFLAFLRRAGIWLAVVLVLSTFEREMILLAVGFLAALELYPWRPRRRFALLTLAGSVLCFAVYLVLRRKLGAWDFQTSPGSLLRGIVRTPYNRDLLFQGFLCQNVLVIAVAAFLVAKRKQPGVRYWMPKVLASFMFLALVSIGCFEGNNTGRLAGILTPIFAAFAALSLAAMQGPGAEAVEAKAYPEGSNRVAVGFLAASLLLLPSVRVYQGLYPRAPKKHRMLLPPPAPGLTPSQGGKHASP